MRIPSVKGFNRIIKPPPDKSIMQRAVVLGLVFGAKIQNPSFCGDCVSAIECVRALGASVTFENGILSIFPPAEVKNVDGLTEVKIDAGNSATAARLIAGAAAGLGLSLKVTGDKSLSGRNMFATVEALRLLGADVRAESNKLPLFVRPAALTPARIALDKPSAQVKSAAILAALFAHGKSTIYESVPTRDHTERLLQSIGIPPVCNMGEFDIGGKIYQNKITVHGGGLRRGKNGRLFIFNNDETRGTGENTNETRGTYEIEKIQGDTKMEIKGLEITVPGDFSSAAYAVAMAAIIKDGRAVIINCGLNPHRTGMLRVLKNAGLDIETDVKGTHYKEPFGDIYIRQTRFNAFNIASNEIYDLIDEIPVLAVMACFAEGISVFSGLSPLKNKESDRVKSIYEGLKNFDADVKLSGDTLIITGGGLNFASKIKRRDKLDKANKTSKIDANGKTISAIKAEIDSSDHRIIMAMSVLAAACGGGYVKNVTATEVSYPDFFDDIIL